MVQETGPMAGQCKSQIITKYIKMLILNLRARVTKWSKYIMGNNGSLNSLKYNFKTPATELISDASVVSASGSSPRSNPSRKLDISTCDPDTLNIPWWCKPIKKKIYLLQMFYIFQI